MIFTVCDCVSFNKCEDNINNAILFACKAKEDAAEQLALFDEQGREKREKQEKLEHALDGIRARYGSHAVQSGGVIGNDIGIDSGRKEAQEDESHGFV